MVRRGARRRDLKEIGWTSDLYGGQNHEPRHALRGLVRSPASCEGIQRAIRARACIARRLIYVSSDSDVHRNNAMHAGMTASFHRGRRRLHRQRAIQASIEKKRVVLTLRLDTLTEIV